MTDTASNMVKAFKLPGFQNEEEEHDEEEEGDGTSSIDDIDDERNVIYDTLPAEHHGCFAHILQLAVKDGLRMLHKLIEL